MPNQMMQTQDLGSFFKAMYDLSKSAKNKDEFVMAASEKFGVLIEDIIKASKKIGDEHTLQIDELKKAAEAKDAKISSLEEQVKLYDGRLLQLEKRVKASENREKRKQKAKVANNIMAKSSSAKSTKQVLEYIHKTINQGVEGTEKVKLQALLDNCDELVPKGGQGDRKSVKVYLTSEQKKALFAGLAKNNKTGSDHGITIQNEESQSRMRFPSISEITTRSWIGLPSLSGPSTDRRSSRPRSSLMVCPYRCFSNPEILRNG